MKQKSFELVFFVFVFFIIVFFNTYEVQNPLTGVFTSPYQVYGGFIALLTFFVSLFKYIRKSPLYKVFSDRLRIKFLFFLLIPGFSGLLSDEPGLSGLRFSFLQFILLFLCVSIIDLNGIKKSIKLVLLSLLVLSTILGVVALARIFTSITLGPINMPQSFWFRTSGWFRSTNHFATLQGVGLITAFMLYNTPSKTRISSFFFIFTIIVIGSSFLLSGSRGAALSIFIVFVFVFVRQGRILFNFRISNLIGLSLIIVGLFIAITFFLNKTGSNYKNLLDDAYRIENRFKDDPRAEIWEQTMVNFSAGDIYKILFGFGRGNSNELAGRSTHNGFLTMLVSYGILYVAYFSYIIVYIFLKLYRNKRYRMDAYGIYVASISIYLISRSMTNNGLILFNLDTFLFFFFNLWYFQYLKTYRNNNLNLDLK